MPSEWSEEEDKSWEAVMPRNMLRGMLLRISERRMGKQLMRLTERRMEKTDLAILDPGIARKRARMDRMVTTGEPLVSMKQLGSTETRMQRWRIIRTSSRRSKLTLTMPEPDACS